MTEMMHTTPPPTICHRVMAVLTEHADLAVSQGLSIQTNLYDAGMTSRASISVMMGLETEFDIEFPDELLRRDVFESVHAIASAVMPLIH